MASTRQLPVWLFPVWIGIVLGIRVLTSSSLEFDEAEQILHSQALSLGYTTQPPLFEWGLHFLSIPWGGADLVSLSLFKVLLISGVYYFSYRALCFFVNKEVAIVGALSLFILPQMIWEIPRTLTHTLLLVFFLVVLFWGYLSLFMEPRRKRHILFFVFLGCALAGALLSKYSAVAVLLITLCATLSIKAMRVAFVSGVRANKWGLLLSLLVCLSIVFPHFFWLLNHWTEATSPIVEKLVASDEAGFVENSLKGLVNLGVSALSFYAVLIILFLIAMSRPRTVLSISRKVDHSGAQNAVIFTTSYLVFFLAFCLALIFIWGTSHFRERWLVSFLFWTPAALVVWMAARNVNLEVFRRMTVGLIVLVGLVFAFRAPLMGEIGKPGWINFPSEQLAKKLIDDFPEDIPVLASSMQLAGNIKLHSPARLILSPTFAMQARHLPPHRSCELLVVRASPSSDKPFGPWPDSMTRVVSRYWEKEDEDSSLRIVSASLKQYQLPALYSRAPFIVEVGLVRTLGPCESTRKN